MSNLLRWIWKPAFGLALGIMTTLLVEKANLVSGHAHLVVTYISAAAGWYLLAVLLNLLAIILIPIWTSL